MSLKANLIQWIVAGIMGVSSITPAAVAQTEGSAGAPSRSSVATDASAANAPSKFRSPEDGWLDLSAFMDEAYGFVPLVFPITEPAVG